MDKIAYIKEKLTIRDLLAKLGIYPNKSGFIFSIYKQEKTPSLRIYEDNNTYFCFATSQGGDVIRFYKDFYRLETKDAIDQLFSLVNGNKYTKPQPIIQQKPKDLYSSLLDHEKYLYDELCGISDENNAKIEVKKSRLEQNKTIFNDLFNYCKKKYSNSDSFKTYMHQERCLSDETIERFKVFYIANYFECNNHLKKHFQADELRASGIVNEKGNLIFAKHRIIIPYLYKGEIVYLRGRYFDSGETKTNGPKYIGLKNDLLNVNTAKRLWNSDVLDEATGGDRLFITEGEFDAMVLCQEGLFACAIPGAGNIPGDKWFRKMVGLRVNLLLDNDEPGEKLRKRLEEKLKFFDIEFTHLYLSNSKDITEFAKEKK